MAKSFSIERDNHLDTNRCFGDLRRGAESNRRIKVLQTSALPLGYRAEEERIVIYRTMSFF